jgi:hypothetical protein
MSEESASDRTPDDAAIDFERVEPNDAGAAARGEGLLECPRCNAEITRYWTINDQVACGACAVRVRSAIQDAYSARAFGRAVLYGGVAMLASSAVWHLIRVTTDMELGLVAIGVGIAIGVAIKRATGGHGGKRYQALAIFLTYSAIALTNVPVIVGVIRDRIAKEDAAAQTLAPPPGAAGAPSATPTASTPPAGPTPTLPPATTGEKPTAARPEESPPSLGRLLIGWGMIVGLAYALPFLAGAQGIMGLVIIAIGLYEAWKYTRGAPPRLAGPYEAARVGSDDGA